MIGKFPILAILGPRQSGKTTLIKEEFSEYDYYNLEDFDIRSAAMADPRGFLAALGPRFALDEVQRVPDLFSYLQTLVDNGDYDIIISGSQNFLLLASITQSLAGRVAIFTLLPLSIEEVAPSDNLNDALLNGSFPGLYDKQIDPSDYYPNYITTYLERDVRSLKNIANLHSFSRFLELIAGRVGQELNMNSLAIDVGVSPKTIKSWISVLEASYLVYLLKPYTKNYNKRIIKSPKLYMTDTGLACSLLGISSNKLLQNHYNRGAIFENYIVMELIKYAYNRGLKPRYYFWKEKNRHEVDLIIDHPDNMLAIEIKSAATGHAHFYRNLKYIEKVSDNNFKTFVVYGGDQNLITSEAAFISWKNLRIWMEKEL